MAIRIVRLGSARVPGEGLRIGTVRRPPRGVPKGRFSKDDWYDVWLPNLSPSAETVRKGLDAASDRAWKAFATQYKREMKTPENGRLLDVLAALSHGSNFSVGCYCAEESRCHRSLLRQLLLDRKADVI